MNTQDQATNRQKGQRVASGNRKIRMRFAAYTAFVAAAAVVATTMVMIGGSEPANACLLGIPCW